MAKPWLKNFIFPPENSGIWKRLAPFIALTVLLILIGAFANFTWEFTNTPKFCGTTCHTMPPQFVTHSLSAHANVNCEDCHLGREALIKMIPGKISYSWQTGTGMLFHTYTYPIIAKNMRPADKACENCHTPEKFSSDKLIELKRYGDDLTNSTTIIDLIMKTGGGTKRSGLSYGIHWHIENPVYFYSADPERQTIPYVKVTKADGSTVEYVDVTANFDTKTVNQKNLQTIDCITCHNRTAHGIQSPVDAVNTFLSQGLVPTSMPEFHRVATDVLSRKYGSDKDAFDGIATLTDFYKINYADYYSKNTDAVTKAVKVLQDYYRDFVFSDQKMTWDTHPDDIGHLETAGCFRCHDGKHLTVKGEAVRLECNLCHSIPLVTTPNQFISNLEISRGIEPSSHKDTTWISQHHTAFDSTCSSCHTTTDPGGVSNSSFCSNSSCHGTNWKFAGFNAPKVRDALKAAGKLITPVPTKVPTAVPTPAPTTVGTPATPAPTSTTVTFAQVEPILSAKCAGCHGDNGPKGISLNSYAKIMAIKGLVVAGNPANSELVKVQSGPSPHFGQLSAQELDLVKKWITAGALEK